MNTVLTNGTPRTAGKGEPDQPVEHSACTGSPSKWIEERTGELTGPIRQHRGVEVSSMLRSAPAAPGTLEARAPQGEARRLAVAPRRSARQYIQLQRPVIVARLLKALDDLAAHARTPAGAVYVSRIEQLTAQATEQLFDDGYLALVLAVRNALAVNNAWMGYTAEQVRGLQAVLRKYADRPHENGLVFRKGALELKQHGVRTLTAELPAALFFDEAEE